MSEQVSQSAQVTRPGLTRPRPLGAGLTRAQARSKRWQRASRGLYLPAGVDCSNVDQRILNAAAAVPRVGAAITGWAALRWHGGRWFTGGPPNHPRDVPVVVGAPVIRSRPGIAVWVERRLTPEHIRWVDGVAVTTPAFAVAFEVRRARSIAEAVTAVDMACYDDLVSLSEMRDFLGEDLRGWAGVARARDVLSRCDENSWSPAESRARLLWDESDYGHRPLCNAPLFDEDGNHLVTPDLLDEIAGVVVEYDGEDHWNRRRWLRDVDRLAPYRRLGLEPVVLTSRDLRDVVRFDQRLRQGYEVARTMSPVEYATLQPPAWWEPTHTVARRRALSPGQRAKLLRYRRPTE